MDCKRAAAFRFPTSGAAASLIVYPYQNVNDNEDGTISQSMNALVTDAFGNPVEDGTAIYFSLEDGGAFPTDAPPSFGVVCGVNTTLLMIPIKGSISLWLNFLTTA